MLEEKQMNITYTSPVKFDVIPIPESIINFQFRLKKSVQRLKLNIDLNIFYKDPYIIGREFLSNSGAQSVYSSVTEDTSHLLKFKVPQFKNRSQSHIYISLEPIGDPYAKVTIEDVKIDFHRPEKVDTSPYTQPHAAMAVPHIKPIVSVPIHTMITTIHPYKYNLQIVNKIMFASTWGVKCGIALYTEDLINALNELSPGSFIINPTNGGNLEKNIEGTLNHLQHEFSIIPNPPNLNNKVIITWHTIPIDIDNTVRIFENRLDVVAHIVPCAGACNYLHTSKDLYVVNLGSTLMPNISKEDARDRLDLKYVKKPIGFVFGFQSPNKNYERLINAAKNTGIHLIISGSTHQCGFKSRLISKGNMTFLDKYLSDEEINLFAIASDLLLYDYTDQSHYSSSSALHRTVGAGKPVVCANTNHFNDIEGVPKFKNQQELEDGIRYALMNQESLGKLSLEYAKKTSWNEIAKRHIEIYKKYVDNSI